ncbi:MAG: tRNA (adenosine(37)-N6)-threonylcarbamoyltransferase complex ATPase subunit type 1 TsaE [Eubacteriales bacterium]
MAQGRSLVGQLKKGAVLALSGDLGAGKTVFVKGMAEGLGITEPILSPTFTLLRQYNGLKHFDVYRIDDPQELNEIGFDEFLNGEEITVIEWAKLIEELLPDDVINVHIQRGNADDERKITIEGI